MLKHASHTFRSDPRKVAHDLTQAKDMDRQLYSTFLLSTRDPASTIRSSAHMPNPASNRNATLIKPLEEDSTVSH